MAKRTNKLDQENTTHSNRRQPIRIQGRFITNRCNREKQINIQKQRTWGHQILLLAIAKSPEAVRRSALRAAIYNKGPPATKYITPKKMS